MTLTATETAVEVGSFAALGLHGRFDQVNGLVEALHELRGDDVIAQRLLGFGDALAQPEHKVTLANVFRQVDEVAKQDRHGA